MKTKKISITKKPNRVSPWQVGYYENKKLVPKFFRTREEAVSYKKDLEKILHLGLTYEQLQKISQLAHIANLPADVLCEWGAKAQIESGLVNVPRTCTFREAAEMFVARATKKCRSTTVKGYKGKNATLNRVFGDRIAATISEHEFAQFIEKIPDRRKNVGKAGSYCRNSYVTQIRMIYRLLGVTKPFPNLIKENTSSQVRFLTCEHVRTLFLTAKPHERGLLALAIFAAIRPSLLSVLPTDCVDVDARIIRLPHYLSKDKKDHILEGEAVINDRIKVYGLPEVLWAWLNAYPFNPRNWTYLCRRLRRGIGHWVQDYTRHTAATYYHAIYGKIPTANLLTHEGLNLVFKHYVGVTTRAAAAEFYAITPESIHAIEDKQGRRPNRQPVVWPSEEQLRQLVATTPTSVLAKKFGCSDTLIAKKCRKLGIPKPGRGHWQKLRFASGTTPDASVCQLAEPQLKSSVTAA
ncbi:MAG: hypothetical protein H3C27_14825 [Opitutaceae bacterium]|nr:hypothetical protein [Opitutaceae bacterium]